jgi:hypothetical protein
MRFRKLNSCLLFICALAAFANAATDLCAETQANKPDASAERAPSDKNKFAIIVAGLGGEQLYSKTFTHQAARLYEALTRRLGFDQTQTFLLTEGGQGGPENGGPDSAPPARRSTAEEMRRAFAAIKSAAKPDSFVLVVLIGHGTFDNQEAKFNLVGRPDLTAKDYAQLIATLPTSRVVFVNCSSASGEFVKPLSSDNRIIITATRSGNEQNATVFAEHFVTALTDPASDGDKNGRISVLEAFNYATKSVADWYKQKNQLASEHALLDDNGDGKGHEEAKDGDGNLARTTYLDSKPVEQAGDDAELRRLLGERERLEQAVEKLKASKADLKSEEYERELERLLVELAQINQSIRARQKR